MLLRPFPIQRSLPSPFSRIVMAMGSTDTAPHSPVHYNHTLPSQFPRWTARESFQFMSARPWQRVREFYSHLVNADVPLSFLFVNQTLLPADTLVPENTQVLDDSVETGLMSVPPQERYGRWARVTYKIVLSYHGASYDGWQKQPGLNTVQNMVESSLGTFVDERKAQILKDKCKPLEGCAVVAGRTDKGVSALQQVCSFYTWKKDVQPCDIENAINNAAPGKIRVVSVSEVSRAFHPNFSAKWRRYLYIFPLNDGENVVQSCQIEDCIKNFSSVENYCISENGFSEDSDENDVKNSIVDEVDEIESLNKTRRFDIMRVDMLLRRLEGKLLSYKVFARDTKASRNVGPPTECFLYHARAAEAKLPISAHGEGANVMVVELVANRFLRKMVRVLVATSIREAAAGAEEDALLKLMDATCRRATAPPAPPDGLCLVDVGYNTFDSKICLIP